MRMKSKGKGKKRLRRERRNEMMNLLPLLSQQSPNRQIPIFKNHPYLPRRFFEPKETTKYVRGI